MKANEFMDMLNKYGELHVVVESGEEYHLHKHDVSTMDRNIVIDSREGRWTFGARRIESIEVPDSHKE